MKSRDKKLEEIWKWKNINPVVRLVLEAYFIDIEKRRGPQVEQRVVQF